MATETDSRLRHRLDANQKDREQMCRSLLALDPHYTDVRPRHPSGGPDGGRDIEAVFDRETQAYAAVGFVNGANDTKEQKRQIFKKFASDLESALEANANLKVFVFLTNVSLSMGEQSKLKMNAYSTGISHCDIFDRERLRIELDAPQGFFIRFQHLGIPLSEAEQASFLSKYGDRIQDVVSTGFQRIERKLDQLLFLTEAEQTLDGIFVHFRLKRSYAASEIGHFRAFVSVHLRAIKLDILGILFGSSDKSNRFSGITKNKIDQPSGIQHGISGGQWESHVKLAEVSESTETEDKDDHEKYEQVGSSSGVGSNPVPFIVATYSHDDPLFRFRPRLSLSDLDECMFMPVLNKSLAQKLDSMDVYANGYKLMHIGQKDFILDDSTFDIQIPGEFSNAELADPWVRIRPSNLASTFQLRFNQMTPRRLYENTQTPDPSDKNKSTPLNKSL